MPALIRVFERLASECIDVASVSTICFIRFWNCSDSVVFVFVSHSNIPLFIADSSSSSSICDESVHNSLNELQTVPKNNIQRQLSLPVQWNRPKSVSNLSSATQNEIHDSDRYLEEILIRNVKVWKCTQQIDNDSVFLEEDNLTTLYED